MPAEFHQVEQNSEEWLRLRAGIPTASEFKKLLTSQGKPSTQIQDYAAVLAAELYAGKPLESWEGNQWTQRGHELEPEARASYEFIHDVEVVRVGFVTNYGAGCSPDSLVGDHGMLEIKCLSPWRHVQALAYWHKHRKCPPDYYPQTQGQLLVCEREWVDLRFHHPELPSLEIRIERAESYLDALLKQIAAVREQRDRLVEMLQEAA